LKIAITLLSCGRTDYTLKTIETLIEKNPSLRDDYILLHGEDRSPLEESRANIAAARAAGFETVLQPSLQYGVAKMTELLFVAAAKRGADLVLNLQNDWISMRPIPKSEIIGILSDESIYTVRLYGAYKSATGRCGIHHGGREPRQVVEWKPHSTLQGVEVGDIHWGHPPAVTRITDAVNLTRFAPSESVSRKRSGEITRLTARFTENVMSHIGRERTPGFRA
jgi:hypothetical protein